MEHFPAHANQILTSNPISFHVYRESGTFSFLISSQNEIFPIEGDYHIFREGNIGITLFQPRCEPPSLFYSTVKKIICCKKFVEQIIFIRFYSIYKVSKHIRYIHFATTSNSSWPQWPPFRGLHRRRGKLLPLRRGGRGRQDWALPPYRARVFHFQGCECNRSRITGNPENL